MSPLSQASELTEKWLCQDMRATFPEAQPCYDSITLAARGHPKTHVRTHTALGGRLCELLGGLLAGDTVNTRT